MKAKSLSVFRTKLRLNDPGTVLVNIGDVIEGDDDHLRALARSKLVVLLEGGTKAKGKTISDPLAGTGEGVLTPLPDGSPQLPPEVKKAKRKK